MDTFANSDEPSSHFRLFHVLSLRWSLALEAKLALHLQASCLLGAIIGCLRNHTQRLSRKF